MNRAPPAAAPASIRRRDGTAAPFDRGRIAAAVLRALRETGRSDPALAEAVADDVACRLAGRRPGVEDVQDAVEEALARLAPADVARAYAGYRGARAELRRAKADAGVRDELKLSLNAVAVLRERYLRRDERGRVVESTGELMDRVATHVAAAEETWAPGSAQRWGAAFAEAMRALLFLPNSPTLMNAGTGLGLLSGCFVLPVDDSLESIFEAVKRTALIHQAGGGTGFSFSRLRPAGDRVASTGGAASGPVPFIGVFDLTTEVVKQGGRRRGANMAVLHVSHPDVREFLESKAEPGRLENLNLSLAVTDRFMRAVEGGGEHRLVNPRTGRAVGALPARRLFRLAAESAWRTGDPGLLFLDRINQANPLPALGRIEATNPCGEVPLLPNESCNLGSINLARLVERGALDWARLGATVRLAARFLDDVIEVNRYPFPELEEAALATRKVGLGVMGLAELLAILGIPYDSNEAVRVGTRIARTVRDEARRESARLAEERGPFPRFAESVYARRGLPPLRNAQLTSVAPTGTISIIAGTTSGIEPLFAVAYVRQVLGRRLVELNPVFERLARDRGFWSDELAAELVETGTLGRSRDVPPDVRRAFRTALEIRPEWHLRMQTGVQRFVDAAVSKTVNLPATASVHQVERLYRDAWRGGAKGITVYRYGSRPDQVLRFLSDAAPGPAPPVSVDAAYAGGCAGHVCDF